jgi:hypothetical protein
MQKLIFTTICSLLFSLNTLKAQQPDENPVAYMNAMSKTHDEMDKKYMQYTSAVAHGKRAKKVEKLRLQVIESIQDARYKILDLPFYKGDKSYRQTHLNYVDLIHKIYNEDYVKVVNMEEIAEQSVDDMEAYILLNEKIEEKLKIANDSVNNAFKAFAAKHNVKLVEGEKSELGQKLEKASKVNKYYRPVDLIFFKCNWQMNKLTKALNENKVSDAEQARISVIKFVNEGLEALEKISAFDGDPSLKTTCKFTLQAYKKVCEKESLVQIDFVLKKENFEKIKKTIDSKTDRTKEEIDAYNKAVKEFNDSVNKANQASANANNQKSQALENWNNAVNAFFDTHVPKY